MTHYVILILTDTWCHFYSDWYISKTCGSLFLLIRYRHAGLLFLNLQNNRSQLFTILIHVLKKTCVSAFYSKILFFPTLISGILWRLDVNTRLVGGSPQGGVCVAHHLHFLCCAFCFVCLRPSWSMLPVSLYSNIFLYIIVYNLIYPR